jgi:hypothetical protein
MARPDQKAMTLRRDVEELARLCKKQNPRAAVNARALFNSVADLLRATGVCTPSKEARIFQEAARRDREPAALWAAYLKAARSADLLSREISGPDLRAGLHGLARVRWAGRAARQRGVQRQSLVRATWTELNEVERAEVRQMARDLALMEKSKITRGAPQKVELDTVILGLADIFIEHAELQRSADDLSDAPSSIFISFCAVALRRVRDASEVSPQALGSRWERIKAKADIEMPTKREEPGRPRAAPRRQRRPEER